MTSHRKSNSFVPKLTALENREVPAVAGSQLSGGVLSVICDNNATNVLVSQTLANVFVQDQIVVMLYESESAYRHLPIARRAKRLISFLPMAFRWMLHMLLP